MPYAVEFLLNREKTERVLEIWKEMAAREYGIEMVGMPHITLGVWDDLDLDLAKDWLRTFTANLAPIPVRFASTGFFANDRAVVFLAALATPSLLELQTRFCREFAGSQCEPWTNYRQDWWVPHITLAMNVENDVFPEAMLVAKQIGLPCEGVLEAITIVEIPSVLNHGTFALTGRANEPEIRNSSGQSGLQPDL